MSQSFASKTDAPWWYGIAVHESQYVPETAPVVVDDVPERIAAMTLHHIDLSLLPLFTYEPCVFVMAGLGIVGHPNSIRNLKNCVVR